MNKISDEILEWLIHDCQYNGVETEVNANGSDSDDRLYSIDDLISALEELKEYRRHKCANCIYHDNYTNACGNGRSEFRGEFTDDIFYCDKWDSM